MQPVKIGLLGLGTVGGGTVSVLTRNADEIARRAGRDIQITLAAAKEYDADAIVGLNQIANITDDPFLVVDNPDVEIIIMDGGYYAVIQYSGRSSDKNFFKHSKILKEKLLKDNIKINGTPIKATYNGPFTLPPFRRNEVMFNIVWN